MCDFITCEMFLVYFKFYTESFNILTRIYKVLFTQVLEE